MSLKGKGFFIWKVTQCEGGNPAAIAAVAKAAGLTHVLLKVADGQSVYNGDSGHPTDLMPAVANALRAQGIAVWGWHYVYGKEPSGEARVAIRRIQQMGLDGYIVNAEKEYKEPGKKDAARRFMTELRSQTPNVPVGVSSYRYPSLHSSFPWREFLEKCDFMMPQVYWMQSHNSGEQLVKCQREFQALTPSRPIVPTGAAFTESGWTPTVGEVLEFLQMARSLNMPAVNFWEWGNARTKIPINIWETIAAYPWDAPIGPQDISERLVEAFNSRDVEKVLSFYDPKAVHVNAQRTAQGAEALRAWYNALFTQYLPGGAFKVTGLSGSGNSRHFTWTANAGSSVVQNGNDTLGLNGDKITYHYTFFTADKV